jgi:GPH family glycoside/pentoside/hexuronide:cation symporter
MIADTIDIEELNTGVRREGVYYGCQTLCYKLSQSAAIFILGILLDVLRFDSSAAVQPVNTIVILGCVLTLGSAAAFMLAYMAYRKYGVDRDKIKEIQIKLSKGEGEIGA